MKSRPTTARRPTTCTIRSTSATATLPAQRHRRVHRPRPIGFGGAGIGGLHRPFIGLFGTVWGIYHALVAIGLSGQSSIDKVAGPIGEALIMTALGLAVAIPAVLGYNALVRGNKSVLGRSTALPTTCTPCS